MNNKNKEWHFLIDANLPPRLCEFFRAKGYEAAHVTDLNMEEASDIAIWKRAIHDQLVVVTKDRDFASLAISDMSICPIVLVRVGNLRRGPLLEKFSSVMQKLISALDNGEKVIELS